MGFSLKLVGKSKLDQLDHSGQRRAKRRLRAVARLHTCLRAGVSFASTAGKNGA